MGIQIYDDGNFHELVQMAADTPEYGRGRVPRDYGAVPTGSLRCAPAFNYPLIPQNEWVSRAKDMEQAQTRLSDLVTASGMPALNQQQTLFCWANAPTNCVRICRANMNEPFVDLSPASVACPINGFRNQGGAGPDALQYIADNGVCSASVWPANAIDRRYQTAAAKTDAAQHRITEWDDFQYGNFAQVVTYLLLRLGPVAGGFDWWGHEVTLLDVVPLDSSTIGIRIYNSWGAWGDNNTGMSVLTGSKMKPDDAVGARVVLGSAA